MADTPEPPVVENAQELSEPTPSTPQTPSTPAEAPPETNPTPADMAHQFSEMSKALQRVQQEISQLNRNKAKQGGELNEEQELKLRRSAEQAQNLRNRLQQYAEASGDEDAIDVQLTKTTLHTQDEVAALKAEVQRLSSQVQAAQPTAEQQWDKWQRTYPGAPVQGIWKDALKQADNSYAVKNAEAQFAAGKIDQEAFDSIRNGAASDIFHREAKAKMAPTASAPPPPPPSGPRTVPMRGGQNPAPPAESDPLMDLIRRESEKMDKVENGRV